MKIGADSISLRLGSVEISKAYLGSELVHDANPLPYTPLTWVGSTGAESTGVKFDLGHNLLSTMTFEFDSHLVNAAWALAIQAAVSDGVTWANDKNQLNIYRTSNSRYDYLYFSSTKTATGNKTGRHTFKLDGGLWMDSTQVTTISTPQSVAAGGSIWINGYKIYGFKLWDNGVLIADFIPALYQGVYGLWDTVNDTFIQKVSGNITGA